jgi:hypothetical protein
MSIEPAQQARQRQSCLAGLGIRRQSDGRPFAMTVLAVIF